MPSKKTTAAATPAPARVPTPAARPKRAPRKAVAAGKPPALVQPESAVGKIAKPEKAAKAKPGHKLVRDSFTIPKAEYTVLQQLKDRAITLARPTKKGELLRAGITALRAMNDKAFLAALGAVPSLKTGRPKAAAASPTIKPA